MDVTKVVGLLLMGWRPHTDSTAKRTWAWLKKFYHGHEVEVVGSIVLGVLLMAAVTLTLIFIRVLFFLC